MLAQTTPPRDQVDFNIENGDYTPSPAELQPDYSMWPCAHLRELRELIERELSPEVAANNHQYIAVGTILAERRASGVQMAGPDGLSHYPA